MNEVIFEKGLIRVSARQLFMLCLELTDKCDVGDLLDIKQPDDFYEELSWSVWMHQSGYEEVTSDE